MPPKPQTHEQHYLLGGLQFLKHGHLYHFFESLQLREPGTGIFKNKKPRCCAYEEKLIEVKGRSSKCSKPRALLTQQTFAWISS